MDWWTYLGSRGSALNAAGLLAASWTGTVVWHIYIPREEEWSIPRSSFSLGKKSYMWSRFSKWEIDIFLCGFIDTFRRWDGLDSVLNRLYWRLGSQLFRMRFKRWFFEKNSVHFLVEKILDIIRKLIYFFIMNYNLITIQLIYMEEESWSQQIISDVYIPFTFSHRVATFKMQ